MSGEPETAVSTEEEFKERFPGAEKAETPESPTTDKQEIPTTRIHECSDGKTRNEEQYQAWKLKTKQFESHPENFIHLDDIVLGVFFVDNIARVAFGKYDIEKTKAALVTLQHRLFNALSEFEYKMQIEAAQKAGLVDANGKPIATPKKEGIIT